MDKGAATAEGGTPAPRGVPTTPKYLFETLVIFIANPADNAHQNLISFTIFDQQNFTRSSIFSLKH